jgi:hypothetical protein
MRMGEWMYRSNFLDLGHYLEVSGQFHAPAAGTHWIGGWVNPRAGLDDSEKRKFLTLSGLELRIHGRPALSQSLYRLRYPGSSKTNIQPLL